MPRAARPDPLRGVPLRGHAHAAVSARSCRRADDPRATVIDVDEPITFDHEQVVHLDDGTFHWVNLKQFRIDPTQTNGQILDGLVAHWAYHDHYAGQDAA